MAKVWLLDPARKAAYDEDLMSKLPANRLWQQAGHATPLHAPVARPVDPTLPPPLKSRGPVYDWRRKLLMFLVGAVPAAIVLAVVLSLMNGGDDDSLNVDGSKTNSPLPVDGEPDDDDTLPAQPQVDAADPLVDPSAADGTPSVDASPDPDPLTPDPLTPDPAPDPDPLVPLPADDVAAEDIESETVHEALAEYQAAVEAVEKSRESEIEAARAKLVADLNAAQEQAAMANELDDAVRIRKYREGVEAEAKAAKLKLPWVPGTYEMKYFPALTSCTFEIRPNGDFFDKVAGRVSSKLRRFRGDVVRDAPPRFERMTFAPNYVFAEHFFSREDFGKSIVNQIGVGQKVDEQGKLLSDIGNEEAHQAVEAFQESVESLRKSVNKEKLEARKVLIPQLKAEQEAATSANDLEEAVRIRDLVARLEAESKLERTEHGLIPGTYKIKYHPNQSIHTLVVQPNGNANWSGSPGTLERQGDAYVVHWANTAGKVERIVFCDRRIFTEHYGTEENFSKNAIDQIGVGERVKGD